jgi:hypothetical protein
MLPITKANLLSSPQYELNYSHGNEGNPGVNQAVCEQPDHNGRNDWQYEMYHSRQNQNCYDADDYYDKENH